MAKLSFPNDDITGNSGHSEQDVMYIGLEGEDAVPGVLGAKWTAKNGAEFEESIKAIGDKLVAKLTGDDAGSLNPRARRKPPFKMKTLIKENLID